MLLGLGIVVLLAMLCRYYDKITHECGKILRFAYSLLLVCHQACSVVMIFLCTSTGQITADAGVAVSKNMSEDLKARVFPNITSLIHNYNNFIVNRLLSLIQGRIWLEKWRILIKEIKYNLMEQNVVHGFEYPSTVLLQ